jgi:hypothetical protein
VTRLRVASLLLAALAVTQAGEARAQRAEGERSSLGPAGEARAQRAEGERSSLGSAGEARAQRAEGEGSSRKPAAGAGAAPGAPACLARAQVVPPEGFPGQQLIWRLEILRRPQATGVDWLEPPSFPGFRAEWLPGQPELGGVILDGVEYIARVEERALFPERAGELVIAPKGLRCSVASGPPQEAGVAATRVPVLALPKAGRPPDFSGLVGSLAVEITAQPSRLALGGSTRVEVTLRGDANLWDARDPLADVPGLTGLERFPAGTRLELEPGVQLAVRRRFAYDLVPDREGRLVIPSLRIPYFDPEPRRYAVASTPELVIEVGPRRSAPGAGRAPAPEPQPHAIPRLRAWWAPVALAAAGLLAWAWRRRARHASRAPGADALAALAAEGHADEPAQLARALRLALEPRLTGARSAPVEELTAPAGADPALARGIALLARIERWRFDPAAPSVERSEVVRAVRELAAARFT